VKNYFSQQGLKGLLACVPRGRFVCFRDAYEQDSILLRHDVDLDLTSCLLACEAEQDLGVRATYFVRVDAEMYNIRSRASIRVLEELQDAEMEVALHFQANGDPNDSVRLNTDLAILQDLIQVPVESMSLHLPAALRGPLPHFEGLINAYSPSHFGASRYLSDSRMTFEVDPTAFLQAKDSTMKQLLLHPEHYVLPDGGDYFQVLTNLLDARRQELHELMLLNSTYRASDRHLA